MSSSNLGLNSLKLGDIRVYSREGFLYSMDDKGVERKLLGTQTDAHSGPINICSSCLKASHLTDCIWNGPKFTRQICKDCYCKVMDKLFDVKVDIETEGLLYGK